MVIFGLVVIAVEAIEHVLLGESLLTSHFLTEIAIYGLIVPAIGSILIESLERLRMQRNRAVEELDHKLALSLQLIQTSNWEEQAQKIVQTPKSILPAESASLYVFDDSREFFDRVACWAANGKETDPDLENLAMDCSTCVHAGLPTMNRVNRCRSPNKKRAPNQPVSYCIPLSYRQTTLGILFFEVPPHERIGEDQLVTLSNLTPEMALALESANLERLAVGKADAVTAERQRIARNLHDTLGQNISLLRLKLDHIHSQAALGDFAQIRKDLEQMRAQADEAYQQMRETLAGLQPGSEEDLENALKAHAEMVGARADFSVEINQLGKPVSLRPHVRREVLYICREALNNIEKHAHARCVSITLRWGERDLSVQLKDDGVGFSPSSLNAAKGFGISIMNERAEDIQAQFIIYSAPQRGTEVELRLPIGAGHG